MTDSIPTSEIFPLQEKEEDKLPVYGTKGWVIVEILSVEKTSSNRFDYELGEYAVDTENSTFWVQEGTGVDWFLENTIDFEFTPGWWVIEDVVGTYHRGDGWTTDDDEEWDYGKIRPATQQEIDQITVIKMEPDND